jgi:hypothetical protein
LRESAPRQVNAGADALHAVHTPAYFTDGT